MMNQRRTNTIALLIVVAVTGLMLNATAHATAAPSQQPLKVFILAGQSNMQGHAQITTFERMAVDPASTPILREMQHSDGTPRVCKRVWISSIGSSEAEKVGKLTVGFGAEKRGPKIGPEFTFGITLEKRLDEPILLIKTAWGGKSLNTDFRPPNAGPYTFNATQLENVKKQGKEIEQVKAERAKATGHYYRLMLEHVQKVLADIKRIYPDYDPKTGYEIAGIVWFQGWNDMVDRSTYPNRDKPGGYDQYSQVMAQFIRDVRKDLSAPKMPFVIGVMGVNGPLDTYPQNERRYRGIHNNFRMAMAAPAALPEFKGNVTAVQTAPYWDTELIGLRARDAKLRDKIKAMNADSTLSRAEQNAALEKLQEDTFNPRELVILRKGASNAGYHYLGSAKTMSGIGKAFAEAVVELMKH